MSTPTLTLGQAMRMYREELGLNQTQMAKRVGVRRGHYSRMEMGKVKNPQWSSFGWLIRERCQIEAISQCSQSSDHYHIEKAKP